MDQKSLEAEHDFNVTILQDLLRLPDLTTYVRMKLVHEARMEEAQGYKLLTARPTEDSTQTPTVVQ